MELPVALKLPFVVLGVLFDCISAALFGAVARPQGWSYARNVKQAIMRSVMKYNLLALLRPSASATTVDVYRAYMKDRKSQPEVVALNAGGYGCWIGPKTSQQVLLYFHGGGYVTSAVTAHMEMLGDLVALAHDQKKDFSVLAVEYSLAPGSSYPVQLAQAAHALVYLIETVGCAPQNIFLAGDSAGGNLAIALLSALSHPHPALPMINLKNQKLAGCFLLSPWVTFAINAPSMQSNLNKDFLVLDPLKECSLQFLGQADADAYNVPLIASPEWWKDLPVRDLCAVGGEYEMFLDDVKAWAQIVKIHNSNFEFYLAPGETHVQPLVHRILGMGIAQSELHFRKWILQKL